MIFINIGNIEKNESENPINWRDYSLKSAQPFQLIREFETSTYYLSPESSPGQNDVAFFSFEANKAGNYTIEVKNYPSMITQSSYYEWMSDFDNPNGTDDWVISYQVFDIDNLADQKIKVLISRDRGNTWENYLVSNFQAEGENMFEYLAFLLGTSVAVLPNLNFTGIMTLINRSDYKFFRSYDKGESWSNSYQIGDLSELGMKLSEDFQDAPSFDMAILKNGSIVSVVEANRTDLTSLVFYQSDDDGETWDGPFNISSTKGYDCFNPMLEVNYTSGDYWLMCKVNNTKDDYFYLRWAKYSSSESLNKIKSFEQFDAKYNNISGNYDFFLGEGNFSFNVVQNKIYNDDLSEIYHIFKSNMTTSANNVSLGKNEALFDLAFSGDMGFNAAFDGTDINLLFPAEYSGNFEIYKYLCYKNNTFWRVNGTFSPFQLTQVMWGGKINGTVPINTSMVKVKFFAESGTTISDSLFLIIDNSNPLFEQYNQISQYFNPQSSNVSIAEVPWDVLPSEEVTSILEVYQEEKALSSWKQLTENNWGDSEPVIFTSDTGIIYILYKTIKSGRNVLNLIKSYDRGTTWSEPTVVYENSFYLEYYTGAAWGDIVCIYEKNEFNSQDYLFRSFDQGEQFQIKTKLSTPYTDFSSDDYVYIPRIVFAKNGQMFLTFPNMSASNPNFCLYTSYNLGLNWTKVGDWTIIRENYTKYLQPDIVYDSFSNEIHLVMPIINITNDKAIFNFLSINAETLIPRLPIIWVPCDIDFSYELEEFSDPKFLLNKEGGGINTIIRAIFIQDFESDATPIYNQITSNDHGVSWSIPKNFAKLNFSSFTSFSKDVFLANDFSDGDDFEIHFSRNTTLIRFQQKSISSSKTSEITFNGINDFGEYLSEGNYTFILRLIDNALNMANETGWIYVDYDLPQIFSIATDKPYPLPSGDVQIQVNATDNTNITVSLYYQRLTDTWQDWERLKMNYNGTHYIADIEGNSSATNVRYYVKATDLAGNVLIDNNEGSYYEYYIPSFEYTAPLMFNEFSSYSSGESHLISLSITNDYEMVKSVIFRYSTDAMATWIPLPLIPQSPEFIGILPPLPGETRTMYYQVVVIDQNNQEHILINTRAVSFYPELPDFSKGKKVIHLILLCI